MDLTLTRITDMLHLDQCRGPRAYACGAVSYRFVPDPDNYCDAAAFSAGKASGKCNLVAEDVSMVLLLQYNG
jgi:hypothetical protein